MFFVLMPFFLLGAYLDGVARTRMFGRDQGPGQQRRLLVPQTEWLSGMLQRHGPIPASSDDSAVLHIIALLSLDRGRLSDDPQWSENEMHHQLYFQTLHAYSFKIIDSRRLDFDLRFMVEHAKLKPVPLSNVRKHLFMPVQTELLPVLDVVRNALVSMGGDASLADDLLCFMLPNTLAQLAVMERDCIVVPRSVERRAFADFPDDAWLRRTRDQVRYGLEPACPSMSHTRFRMLFRELQDWSARLSTPGANVQDVVQEINTNIAWVRDIVFHLDPRRSARAEESNESQIFVALASMLVKNQSQLDRLLKLCDHMMVAGSDARWCEIPSAKTVRRAQFRLDMSLNIFRTQEQSTQPEVRWAWIDSSPISQRNFLNAKIATVPLKDVVATARAANALSLDCSLMCDDEDDDVPFLERLLLDRESLSKQLLSMTKHALCPVVLGSGRSGLDHKTSAFAYQLYLETLSAVRFRDMLGSIRSITTDLGVEIGIAEWRTETARSLLPPWVDCDFLRCDVAAGAAEVSPAADVIAQQNFQPDPANDLGSDLPPPLAMDVDPVAAEGCEIEEAFDQPGPHGDAFWANISKAHLLPMAMGTAGSCHLLHTICQEGFEGMVHWDKFWEQLQVLDKLLMLQYRLDRLIGTCFSEDDGDKKILEQMTKLRLYKKRWNVVVAFLSAVMPVLGPLRRKWDLAKFQGGGAEPHETDDGFNAVDVSAVLLDPLFTAYYSMVMLVHNIPKHLMSWTESCSCHDYSSTRGTRPQCQKRLRDEFRHEVFVCPLGGCRSAEMATGALIQKLQSLLHRSRTQLLRPRSFVLSAEQQQLLLSDFEVASSRIDAMVRLKFNFWTQLPWKLCGMSHWDPAVARRCAEESLSTYDLVALETAADVNHRVTVFFLDPRANMRAHVQSFADGLPMHDNLEVEVMILRLIPVAERIIEREHKPLNAASKNKRTSRGAAFSCASRCPDVLLRMESDRGFVSKLAGIFGQTRDIKFLLRELGLARHPGIMALTVGAREGDHDKVWYLLERVVYRHDRGMQFSDLSAPLASHKKRVNMEHKRAERMLHIPPKRRRLGDESFKEKFAFEHLHQVIGMSKALSVPKGAFKLYPLAEALRGQWETLALDTLPDIIRLKFVHASFGRKMTTKMPHAAFESQMKQDDIVVSLHGTMAMGSDEHPVISMRPSKSGSTTSPSLVMRLEDGLPFGELLDTALMWDSNHVIIYTLLGTDLDPVSNAMLTGMLVEASAFPDADNTLQVPDQDPIRGMWLSLEQSGHVARHPCDTEHSDCFKMTAKGLESLTYGEGLCNPTNVFAVRPDLALEDYTMLECILTLESKGFQWQVLPCPQRRQGLMYRYGGPLVWYSTGAQIPIRYLHCLIDAQRLAGLGINEFPHHVSRDADKFYSKVLQGLMPPVPVLQPRRRVQALQLDVGDDDDIGLLPMVDVVGEAVGQDPQVDVVMDLPVDPDFNEFDDDLGEDGGGEPHGDPGATPTGDLPSDDADASPRVAPSDGGSDEAWWDMPPGPDVDGDRDAGCIMGGMATPIASPWRSQPPSPDDTPRCDVAASSVPPSPAPAMSGAGSSSGAPGDRPIAGGAGLASAEVAGESSDAVRHAGGQRSRGSQHLWKL